MKPIIIKDKKDHYILSHASSVFIKSITKDNDIYIGCVSNMDCFQNVRLNPGNIVYYNKKDINGIFLEESTGNELHSVFHYKILGVEMKRVKKEKESPMSFIGCEV